MLDKQECGNALVHPDTLSKPLEEQSLVGSMMILEANSYQDALGLLKQDIYYTTGVVSVEFVHLEFARYSSQRIVGR